MVVIQEGIPGDKSREGLWPPSVLVKEDVPDGMSLSVPRTLRAQLDHLTILPQVRPYAVGMHKNQVRSTCLRWTSDEAFGIAAGNEEQSPEAPQHTIDNDLASSW